LESFAQAVGKQLRLEVAWLKILRNWEKNEWTHRDRIL
jgi:hypothetical protein